jgi:hypothetical protein
MVDLVQIYGLVQSWCETGKKSQIKSCEVIRWRNSIHISPSLLWSKPSWCRQNCSFIQRQGEWFLVSNQL